MRARSRLLLGRDEARASLGLPERLFAHLVRTAAIPQWRSPRGGRPLYARASLNEWRRRNAEVLDYGSAPPRGAELVDTLRAVGGWVVVPRPTESARAAWRRALHRAQPVSGDVKLCHAGRDQGGLAIWLELRNEATVIAHQRAAHAAGRERRLAEERRSSAEAQQLEEERQRWLAELLGRHRRAFELRELIRAIEPRSDEIGADDWEWLVRHADAIDPATGKVQRERRESGL